MFAVYRMHFQNGTQGPLDNFMIQFNKNSFGLAPGSQNVPVPQLGPGSSQTAVLPLVQNPALVSPTAASSLLQVCAACIMCSYTYTCVCVRAAWRDMNTFAHSMQWRWFSAEVAAQQVV